MWKSVRWIAAVVLSVPALCLSYYAWSNPDGFSRQFLRSGGRMVKKMADHPGRVAAFLAVSVVLLWTIIVIRCAWEAWRERRNEPVESTQTVANGGSPL